MCYTGKSLELDQQEALCVTQCGRLRTLLTECYRRDADTVGSAGREPRNVTLFFFLPAAMKNHRMKKPKKNAPPREITLRDLEVFCSKGLLAELDS